MSIRLVTDLKRYPKQTREHLIDRMQGRIFLEAMKQDWIDWLVSKPAVPDLQEAPQGWYKNFQGFSLVGEGEFIKTLYTIYSPGQFRKGAINLDTWTKSRISSFKSKLLKKVVSNSVKKGYGYDTTGVINEENQTNQRDTNKQREKVEDSPNPANIAVDGEALAEFPELKNPPNRLPTRNLF